MSSFNIHDRFYLSTDGYYFKYRYDKYNPELMHATLFNTKGEIKDKRVVGIESELTEQDHFKTINYFEARLTTNDHE